MGKSYVQWVSTSIFPYISLFQNKLIKILLVQSSKLRSRLPQEATRSDSTRIQQWNNIDIFPDYPATEPPWKSTNLWSSKRKTRTHSKGKTTMVCCYKRLLLNTRSQCIFLVSLLLAQRLKITLWHFNIAREQSPCYRGNHPTTWAMGNLGFSTSQTVELPKSDPTLLG